MIQGSSGFIHTHSLQRLCTFLQYPLHTFTSWSLIHFTKEKTKDMKLACYKTYPWIVNNRLPPNYLQQNSTGQAVSLLPASMKQRQVTQLSFQSPTRIPETTPPSLRLAKRSYKYSPDWRTDNEPSSQPIQRQDKRFV